jgi:hypothetical protein
MCLESSECDMGEDRMHVSCTRSWNPFRRGWILLPATILAALVVGWAAGETTTLYLRIRCAPVKSEPSFAAGEIKDTATAGQPVSVLERSKDGDWAKVRFTPERGDEKKSEPVEGWIHATVLSDKPVIAERDSGCPWLREGGKALPEAGTVVKEHATKRRQDIKPILEAEKLYPSEKELDTFLKDGSLGLYRPDWPSLEGGLTK